MFAPVFTWREGDEPHGGGENDDTRMGRETTINRLMIS